MFRFGYIVLVLILFSCQKKETVNIEQIDMGLSVPISSIKKMDNQYYLLGGDNVNGGQIITTADFQNFDMLDCSIPYAVYDIASYNNKYIITCDSAKIYRTTNFSAYDKYYFTTGNWAGRLHKNPLRKILEAGDGSLHIVGGANLQYGVYYYSADTAKTWQLSEYNNELRTIFQYEETIWKAGFGIMMKSTDYGKTWKQIDVQYIYITDMYLFDRDNGVFCSYDGKIYITENGGEKLKTVYNNRKAKTLGTIGFNRIKANGDKVIALGGEQLLVSYDKGNSWVPYKTGINEELKDFYFTGDKEIVVTGTNGYLGKITGI